MDNLESSNYQGLKERIKAELNRTVQGFVEIGYMLKRIRDEKLYELDGYSNITEFAKAEYNLNQSDTSRFIDINTKYSIDGNSLVLLEQYEGYGSSKLSEMLSMSEEELQLVTVHTTRAEIREIKQAKKESENENYAPAHNSESIENTQSEADFEGEKKYNIPDAEKLLIDMYRDKKNREVLKEMAAALTGSVWSEELEAKAAEIINPSGYLFYRKIAVIMIFGEKTIKYESFKGGKYEFTYREFVEDLKQVFDMDLSDPWVAFYGEPEPDPVQKEPEKKAAVSKPNKQATVDNRKSDTKPEITKPKEDKKKQDTIVKEPSEEPNVIPGQMEVNDYPEIQPETEQESKNDNSLSCKFDLEARCLIASKESCKNQSSDNCMYYKPGFEEEDYESEADGEKIETVEADIVENAKPEEQHDNDQQLYSDDNMEIDLYDTGELTIIIRNNADKRIKKIKAIDGDTGNIWEVEVD